jgi:hypothetical protein
MANLRTFTLMTLAVCVLWGHPLALAQIQAGRAPDGTVWLTDGHLPGGVQAAPFALDSLMTLPGSQSNRIPEQTSQGAPSTLLDAGVPVKTRPEDRVTCSGIQKRLNETQTELATVERKKAAGTLLIPDSGMVTLRQNLATLERLSALCD